MKILALLLALMLPTLVQAQAPKRQDVYAQAEAIISARPQQAVQIYNWLKNTPEIGIHQMRGATRNQVYLHPEGHKEAVYDEAGKLVQDGYNDGSYNLFLDDQPLKHFLYDILPWIVWGATPKDPTSREERIEAYVVDLGKGLTAYAEAERPSVDLARLSRDERAVLAMIMNAVDAGEAQQIYAYLADPARKFSADEWRQMGQNLERGLRISLKYAEPFLKRTPRAPRPKEASARS